MLLGAPFTKESIREFVAQSTVLPLTLASDGLGCFTVAAELGAAHDRTVTGGGKASVELGQFRAVNTIFGNLKTALTGTYRAVKFAKYAARCPGELQYRYKRRYDLRSILPRLIRAAAAAKPQREALLRGC